MTRSAPMQTNFTAGEFSPLMGGHINLEKYPDSCSLLQNMIPLKQGPVTRRGGTIFVKEVKDSADPTALVPFQFSTQQAYMLEFGDAYIRVYKDRAYIHEFVSPYAASSLFRTGKEAGQRNFQYVQSADVLYVVHADYAPRAITRTGDTAWTVTTMELNDGPYLDENASTTTLTLSDTTGSVTVTASAVTGINGGSGFLTTDVGRVIRWHDGSNWTWMQITAVGTTTSVTATIKGANAGGTTATVRWRLGAFSATTGWPTVITFYQDRVFLAGCAAYPDFYALTATGGYSPTRFSFAPSDADGTVTDDAGITGFLQSGQVSTIQWARTDKSTLVIGTAEQEFALEPGTTDDVLTPTSAKAGAISSTGGAYIQALQADTGALFVQRARRKLFDVAYSYEQDRLVPIDRTLLAEHITRGSIAGLAFQQEPINVVWARLADGGLRGMTYYPSQNLFPWARFVLGGADVKVKDLAVIPAPDGSHDDLWLIVERTIDGDTVQYVEYMSRFYEDDMAKADAVCMDCALVYDGVETDTVTGLAHLEGEEVQLFVDGNTHPPVTVESGAITLAQGRTGSTIAVGLQNKWAFLSSRIEAGARDGVAQGKIKRLSGLAVRILNGLGLRYGPSADALTEETFNAGAGYDESTPLFSGDKIFRSWPGGYETDGRVYLEHDGPLPMTILALMPDITTYDRG
jgi:hypothetical protein